MSDLDLTGLDWGPLDRALDQAREAFGAPPRLWLRDDDAVAPTPALDRLLALTEAHGIPAVLAAIPGRLAGDGLDGDGGAGVGRPLARRLAGTRALVAPHGWAHENHAGAGEKKAEFGAHRALEARLAEAAQGLTIIRAAFGDRARAMFAPPWNRIAEDMSAGLAGLGYTALSSFQPRPAREAAPGLVRLNTHWDPIDWPAQRAGRSALLPAQGLVETLAAGLAAQASGAADADEPYGLLTHHLIHDAGVWAFLEALLAQLSERARWVDPLEA